MCKESVEYYWSEREKAEKSSSLKFNGSGYVLDIRNNRIKSTRIDKNFTDKHFQRSTSSGKTTN